MRAAAMVWFVLFAALRVSGEEGCVRFPTPAETRLTAAGALLRMEDGAGLPVLEETLRGDDLYLMGRAANELVAAGDARAIDQLVARLAIRDEEAGRIVLVSALRKHLVFSDRVPGLRTVLIDVMLNDLVAEARHAAINSLLRDDHPTVLQAFRAALEKETYDVARGVARSAPVREGRGADASQKFLRSPPSPLPEGAAGG